MEITKGENAATVVARRRRARRIISLDLAVNAIVAGLLLGGFYPAVTVGVTISFGIANIAHPAFIMLGSSSH